MLIRMTSPGAARCDARARRPAPEHRGPGVQRWKERGCSPCDEGATDFERLNRRMHNKQMIVDNRVAVIGGRNVGDE